MFADKLTIVLPALIFLIFIIRFNRAGTSETYLLFVLYLLPFMAFKVAKEDWGGFKIVDIISYYSFFFLFSRFITFRKNSPSKYFWFLFFSLIIIVSLGGLASEYPEKTILRILKILPVFIFSHFLITECYISKDFFWKAINGLKFGLYFSLFFLIIQIFIGIGFTWYPDLNPNIADTADNFTRYPGVFYDPQIHGQYLAMSSFILFVRPQRKYKFSQHILLLITFGLTIVALALTGSRSAFGGFILGLTLVIFYIGRQNIFHFILILLIGLPIFYILIENSPVFNRPSSFNEDLNFRQSIWNDAFEIVKEYPSLGIGWGNYQQHVMRHYQDQYLVLDDEILYFDQPENGYLKILVELGVIGFSIFLLLIFSPILLGLITLLKTKNNLNILFLIVPLISWLVAFNTVYSLFDERILFLVVTLLTFLIYTNKNEVLK
jgi:hypothetical protein